MAFPIIPIAMAAASLIGGLANNRAQKKRQQDQFKDNRSMASYAYDKDLEQWNRQTAHNREMWELQNEYNDPANQMARLRAAGLNPNLVASGGGSAGGTAAAVQAASSPSYQQVRANYDHRQIDIPNVLAMYTNLQQSMAQVDNMKAATELTEQRTLSEGVERALKTANLVGKGYQNQMAKELSQYSGTFARFSYMKQANELKQQMATRAQTFANTDLTKVNTGYRRKELQMFQDYGMRSGDPIQYRLIMNLLEKMMGGRLPIFK